jgi:hypothetical protein
LKKGSALPAIAVDKAMSPKEDKCGPYLHGLYSLIKEGSFEDLSMTGMKALEGGTEHLWTGKLWGMIFLIFVGQ